MKQLIFTLAVLFITSASFAQKTTSTSESSKVTVTDDTNQYSINAKFTKPLAPKLLTLITKTLNTSKDDRDGTQSWVLGVTYSVKLEPHKLTVQLNKEIATAKQIENFKQMGEKIQDVLNK